MSTSTSKSIWNFDPRSVPGCVLWLDASDPTTITRSGSNMTQWADKSILGNTMTAFSNFSNVTVSSNYQNGLNVLNFSGAGVYQAPVSSGVYPVDVYLVLALKDTTTHVDVFAVESSNAGSEFNSLSFGEYTASRWHNGSDGFARTPNMVSPSNETSTSFLLMNWSISNSNYIIRRFGTELKQTTTYSFTFPSDSRFQVGYRVNPNVFSPSNTAGPFRGYIGEIIAFNSQLETTKRQQVEGYLSWKWGLVPPSTSGFLPTSISSCELWFDGGDYTTMFQNTAGTSNVTTSNQSVARWNDKVRNLSVSNTGVLGQSVLAPTSVSGGGIFFSNTSSVVSSSAQGLGVYLTGASNQDAYLFRMPTKYMTMIVASYPMCNDNLRQVCGVGSHPIGNTVPNFFMGPEIGAGNGGSMLYDYNGSSWGQVAVSSSGYNSNTALRVDSLLSDVTPLWLTNGNSNTFTTTNNYSTSNSNYPINYVAMGAYSSTIVGSRNYHGNIYEIILYSKILSTSERKKVESYLSKKWSIPLSNVISSSHPFYSIKPYLRIFQPTDITTCALWLDGNDVTSMTLSGTDVTQWNDKSGNGYNMTGNRYPVFISNAFSNIGRSLVRFTQSDSDLLSNDSFPSLIGSGPATYFLVEKDMSIPGGGNGGPFGYTSGPNFGIVFQYNGGLQPFYLTSYFDFPFTSSNARILQIYEPNASSGLTGRVNGSTTYNGSNILFGNNPSNGTYSGSFEIGHAPNGYVNADICELIVYNAQLTTSEIQQVEGYLAWKWRITLGTSTHPFYKFAPSTALPFFPKNITGLSLWLDGNDPTGSGAHPSAGSLLVWKDKSGSNNDMIAVGTAPTFSNNPPGAVYFGGSGYFSNSSAVLSNIYTIFFMYKSTVSYAGPLYTTGASSGYSGLFPNEGGTLYLTKGDSTWYTDTSMLPNNQMNLVVLSYSGNDMGCNINLYYNGNTTISDTQSSTITYSNFLLGSRQSAGTSYLTGYIYEVIAYSGTLTTRQRQSVEGYLAQKWKL